VSARGDRSRRRIDFLRCQEKRLWNFDPLRPRRVGIHNQIGRSSKNARIVPDCDYTDMRDEARTSFCHRAQAR
jgi:hypothetical protein